MRVTLKLTATITYDNVKDNEEVEYLTERMELAIVRADSDGTLTGDATDAEVLTCDLEVKEVNREP